MSIHSPKPTASGIAGNEDLTEIGLRLGIRYFLVAYSPLVGDTRTCLIPISAMAQVQKDGCLFCGAMYFNVDAASSDLALVPDSSTFIQLPWKPEFGWVHGNLYHNKKPFDQCPRFLLINRVNEAKKHALTMKTGVEAEFVLFSKDRKHLADPLDATQSFCLHEPLSIMRHADFLTKIHDIIQNLGWLPYRIFHEASSCQFEINFGYEDCLITADRLCFFKFMIKELAELNNMSVTFMPFPDKNLICNSGLHINLSMWDVKTNTNLFIKEAEECSISETAKNCLGGLLAHANEYCALLCPTVNSYKRLNRGSWCPNKISWGFNNRSAMVRIPAYDRMEQRLADGSCSPHLAHAALLASAVDGILKKIDPESPIMLPIEKETDRVFMRTPSSLLEALQHLDKSSFLREVLGDSFIDSFLLLKKREWELYSAQLIQWELDYYFNC